MSQNEFKNNLIKYFNDDFIVDGKELLEKIIENNAYVTGGVIPAILNKNKDYGDIDIICCSGDSFKNLCSYVETTMNVKPLGTGTKYFGVESIKTKSSFAKYSPYEVSTYQPVIFSHPYSVSDEKDMLYKLRGLALIEKVVTFFVNNKSLQFICLKHSDIIEYIGSFDLDICRNYFDGTKLYIEELQHITDKKMILYRYKNQKGEIVDYLLDARTTERVEKYRKRGYKLVKEVFIYLD